MFTEECLIPPVFSVMCINFTSSFEQSNAGGVGVSMICVPLSCDAKYMTVTLATVTFTFVWHLDINSVPPKSERLLSWVILTRAHLWYQIPSVLNSPPPLSSDNPLPFWLHHFYHSVLTVSLYFTTPLQDWWRTKGESSTFLDGIQDTNWWKSIVKHLSSSCSV